MCLIIDNNVVQRVLEFADDPDFAHLRKRILDPGDPVKIDYGGKLTEEYFRNGTIRRLIVTLDRAGLAIQHSEAALKEAERNLPHHLVQSDDEHILALALISGARVLCSHDQLLHADFTNRQIIPSPRGKIYQNSSHNHLLQNC